MGDDFRHQRQVMKNFSNLTEAETFHIKYRYMLHYITEA